MTRAELIARLINDLPSLPPRQVEAAFQKIMDIIAQNLADGNRVELRGFGSFGLRGHSAHEGRNPKTGAKVTVEQKKVPYFRAGKKLKKVVDQLHKDT
ncbi:DUF4496 domain-containing protein [Aristophania vespae]|uniref:DUF4496 domain-containing protein n=1 Tax=Aristophania vespae TaxID=2697033 RepID=A0A6P1NAN8_9PROT|nr:HU family DNA-binding protein [Aristophania vespae]QHI95725.1 DUF4496 domain-containing protein [Aristophania vespae]